MGNAPFFSVIIPTYNPPDLIFKTLESVLSQTFKDFEIVVVDDASPHDVRGKLARHLESGQLRYARNEKNGERAVTRNHGLRIARGQWATFLDHDDLMYTGCLQDAHSFIVAHPEFQFVHNLNQLIDPCGTPLRKYQVPLSRDPAWDLMNGNFLACIGSYIRRDAFEEIRFDESRELLSAEDYEYWLRLLAHTKKLGRIEKINSGIVEHSERTVHRMALERTVASARLTIEKVTSNAVLTGFYPPRYLKRFEAVRYLFIAMALEAAGEYSDAARHLLKAVTTDRSMLLFPLFLRSTLRLPYRAVTRQRSRPEQRT